MQISRVALEHGMRLELNHHVQIARRPPVGPRLAFARKAHAVIGIHARWNLDLQRFRFFVDARAVTSLARMLDDLARAATLRAGLLHREKALRHAHGTRAFAGWTGLGIVAFFSARAMTNFAGFRGRNAQLGSGAARGFLSRDFEVVAKV